MIAASHANNWSMHYRWVRLGHWVNLGGRHDGIGCNLFEQCTSEYMFSHHGAQHGARKSHRQQKKKEVPVRECVVEGVRGGGRRSTTPSEQAGKPKSWVGAWWSVVDRSSRGRTRAPGIYESHHCIGSRVALSRLPTTVQARLRTAPAYAHRRIHTPAYKTQVTRRASRNATEHTQRAARPAAPRHLSQRGDRDCDGSAHVRAHAEAQAGRGVPPRDPRQSPPLGRESATTGRYTRSAWLNLRA